jgi:hypothetical protein
MCGSEFAFREPYRQLNGNAISRDAKALRSEARPSRASRPVRAPLRVLRVAVNRASADGKGLRHLNIIAYETRLRLGAILLHLGFFPLPRTTAHFTFSASSVASSSVSETLPTSLPFGSSSQ